MIRFKEKNAFKRNFFELNKLCRQYNLDLLHTQYFIPFFRVCPVVCTIHDICFEHYNDIFTKKEYIRQKLLIPYASKKAKFIFTVSKYAKNDIINTYGISQDRVIITYNSVNQGFKRLNSAELNEPELRDKFRISDVPYILSVGNLQPRKNLPRLIRAFLKFLKNYNYNRKLVIVGKKAWMYDDILKTACQNNENIILTDYVTDIDLVRLYNAAECFIYPSFYEGFGIPPLESMACGTPVAVSNKTSLPEVVGNAGVYFNPFDENDIEDTIANLIGKIKDGQIDYTAMERQVQNFSWKKSADEVIATYRTVIK